MQFYQKIKIEKDGDKQALYYENNEKKFYRKLDDAEFHHLFENIKPNIEFSLPDKIIQHFVKDGTLLPSFKTSQNFKNTDFDDMIKNIKDEFTPQRVMKRERIENKKKAVNKKSKRHTKKKIDDKVKKINEAKKRLMKKFNVKSSPTIKNKTKKKR